MSQGVSTTANSAHVPIAEALGAWCAALEWGDIPPAVQATVPLRILDHVGLLFAGAATDAGHIALAYAKATGGAPEAILVGERIRLPAAAVALAHVHGFSGASGQRGGGGHTGGGHADRCVG